MAETSESRSDQDALQAQTTILDQWHRLKSEHQLGLVVALLNQVLAGEHSAWMLNNLEMLWKLYATPEHRLLPCFQITHSELEKTHLTPEEIAQFDNDDLAFIAHIMLKHYLSDVFSDDLEIVARDVLNKKDNGNPKEAYGMD